MCEKGLSREQLRLMIGQTDDALATSQQWIEKLHQLADSASLHDASVSLAQATVLLGQTRSKLEGAIDSLELATDSPVTVQRL